MTDYEYNALAAARKYVLDAYDALRLADVADAFKQRRLAAVEADLAKIDVVLDSVDFGTARRG